VKPTEVQIAGAGIAAASTARELAENGIAVRVFEAEPEIAAGASGVPVTVMHPRLLANGSPTADLRATAYAHAAAACQPYLGGEPDPAIVASGALQIASPSYSLDRLAAVEALYRDSGLKLELLEAGAASDLAGVSVNTPALWFADACLVNTPALCKRLLNHENIRVETNHPLTAWPGVPTVLACGQGVRAFPGAGFLELAAVGGQLDIIESSATGLGGLALPIVGNGYLAPLPSSMRMSRAPRAFGVGATYEYKPWPVEKATEHNLKQADKLGASNYRALRAHKASRSVSSDRQPVIGALYGMTQQEIVDKYVTTGHGSMGTVTSHLGGALLAARLSAEVSPLIPTLEALVSPRRFRVRQARRGYRLGATA
jgi:tRNA 5-methylaminomethyl-2-thiouridine biosynthesis bifunctional protein